MKVLSAVAWPYTNGPRHIGHVAGFGVPSDVFSRYMRMAGHDVLMVSGTDEHGTPILVLADKEGVGVQEIVDKYNAVIAADLTDLGLSYDLFTRTTTRNHYAVVQEMFRTIRANGYMIEQTTQTAVSATTGRTLPDRYIEGTCPICGFNPARGDQCDNCGNQLDPTDLIDPVSKVDGSAPKFIDSTHFFLDLVALADALQKWLDEVDSAGTWRPGVINFAKGIAADMHPRAMTRDIDWGIPIPVDGWETKRFYVWFDAVIGYLSASIEWARRLGEPEKWREWWNDPQLRSYYFQGKDNITFHAQIWPAELLGYRGEGDKGGEPGPYGELQLPTEVVASGFLNLGSDQFSTSRGNVIYVRDMLDTYGADALRYFICAAGPETQDSEFTWDGFVTRNNTELVAGWGNLVNRTASMVAKSFGEIPTPGQTEPIDEKLLSAIRSGFDTVGELLEKQRQKAAIAEVMRLVREANKYVTDTEPFRLKGDDQRERLATVLHTLVQAVSDLNTMMAPFLPHSSNKIAETLGATTKFVPMPRLDQVTDLDDPERGYPVITGDYSDTPSWESRPVVPGTPIAKPTPIFAKLDAIDPEDPFGKGVGGASSETGSATAGATGSAKARA
ncbi:methionine--tRNA ligase [Rudaeicoccus suwonensis]|uniref:Methionine--tRNA ligase n=1 Tax=Rudaeicoccus suwonensis TaxID=657409 RepID=A0A561E852_9MICO|nr:methionine--tRNA ligase [Rudaeicoccus suwonensis]TWE11794.1 methionyl-tRNA synthetase [Rudaeicoccus suwonensis]